MVPGAKSRRNILTSYTNVYTIVSMVRDKQINFRISEKEKKLLEEDAKKEERSVSNLLLWSWKQWRNKKR